MKSEDATSEKRYNNEMNSSVCPVDEAGAIAFVLDEHSSKNDYFKVRKR